MSKGFAPCTTNDSFVSRHLLLSFLGGWGHGIVWGKKHTFMLTNLPPTDCGSCRKCD